MATPTCPKCDGTGFEIQEIEIHNSELPHSAVICSSCGAIVSVTDSNLGARVERIMKSQNISFD